MRILMHLKAVIIILARPKSALCSGVSAINLFELECLFAF
jgi:hypothetical protein